MICPNCGNNLSDGSQFCEHCGSNLVNNQNIQQEIQPNVEQQIIQTQVENIQLMPQSEVQPTIENQNIQPENNQNKPKKGSTALIIIIVIMLMCIVGLLLFIFVINKDKNKDENEKEKEINNTTTTTTTTTTTKKDDDNNQNANLKLTDGYLEIKKQYETFNKYTKIDDSINEVTEYDMDTGKYEKIPYTIEINNKEVEATIEGEKIKIDINNEKAKYLTYQATGAFKNQDIYILTEEGNIYGYKISKTSNEKTEKIKSSYKFDNFTMIRQMDDNYSNIFINKQAGSRKDSLIGITSEGNYILLTLFFGEVEINLGKPTKFLISASHDYVKNYHEVVNGNQTAPYDFDYYSLCIFSNGEINYISSEEIKNKNRNEVDLNSLFNKNILVDENNNPLKVKKILHKPEDFKSETSADKTITTNTNRKYLITQDNRIYTIDISTDGVVTKLYNENKIKNYKESKSEREDYYKDNCKKIEVEFVDGSKWEFDGFVTTFFE